MMQNALPTVPELQAVRLPPEILAAADALMKQQLDAMRAPTREMSLAQVEAATQAMKPVLSGAEGPVGLPVASDPLPELALKPSAVEGPVVEATAALTVQANTLDEVNEPAHDVVRIPTQEIEAVGFDVKPVVIPVPAAPSVALNDSLSVSADLLAEGAMTLSAEEVEAIHANTRRVWMVFGGIVGAALALIGVVVMLATQQPAAAVMAPVHPVTRTVKAPIAARPALDELTPLTKVAQKAAPAKTSARPGKVERVPVVEAEPAPAPAVETAPMPEKSANAADFNFLEGAEAPRSELKRPSTEL